MKFIKAFDYINKALELFIMFAMGTLVIICFLAVFFRYFVGSSLFWADEFMRYLFVWATMLGSGLLVRKKAHITVDFTNMMFSVKSRKIVAYICYGGIVVLGVCLMILSFQLLKLGIGQQSSAMDIDMGYVYISFPIGFFMMAINGIMLIIEEYTMDESNVCEGGTK